LGGYIRVIREAANASGIAPNLINRGMNGAMIKNIRDGGLIYGMTYPDFDTALAMDNANVVNIMIGINDVWFQGSAGSSDVTDWITTLMDLVGRVQRTGAKAALATVSLIGERQAGLNQDDSLLDTFAAAAQFVSTATGATLSNVRVAMQQYEANHNTDIDGGLGSGVLTVDGVHPCMSGFDECPAGTHGNTIMADTIAKGLLDALLQK